MYDINTHIIYKFFISLNDLLGIYFSLKAFFWKIFHVNIDIY